MAQTSDTMTPQPGAERPPVADGGGRTSPRAPRPRPASQRARATPALAADASPTGNRSGDWLYGAFALGRRMVRFWPTVLMVFVVGAAFSAAALPGFIKSIYRSESVLLFREGIQANNTRGDENNPSRRLGPRLKDMLLARTRLEQIVDEFNLYPKTVARDGKIDAVEELRSHIDFKAREGDTFHITFDGESPQLAYAVTNRLAEGLMEENARIRVEQASATKDFLEVEKQRSDDELRGKEQQLAQFLALHPEFADESGGKGGPSAGASVRAQEKKERDLKTASTAPNSNTSVIFALERQAMRLRERIKNPSAPPPPISTPAAPIDPKLLSAKNEADSRLASAQKDLNDKSARFTDQHPDVAAARAKVSEAEARVQAAQAAILQARTKSREDAPSTPGAPEAPADVDALKAQLTRVEHDIVALRNGLRRSEPVPGDFAISDAANNIVALETTWSRLNRDVIEARERNNQLVDRLFKATIASSVESSGGAAQMVVVDPAFVPTKPFSFGKVRVIAGGMAVALLVGLLVSLLRAIFDQRLYDEVDVRRLDLPSLGGWAGGYPLIQTVPRSSVGKKSSRKGVVTQ
jgi:hypothetical protein